MGGGGDGDEEEEEERGKDAEDVVLEMTEQEKTALRVGGATRRQRTLHTHFQSLEIVHRGVLLYVAGFTIPTTKIC